MFKDVENDIFYGFNKLELRFKDIINWEFIDIIKYLLYFNVIIYSEKFTLFF